MSTDYNDWKNAKNYDPRRDGKMEYYEDTHVGGVYTGFQKPKPLPTQEQPVVQRAYQNIVMYNPKTLNDVQGLIDYLKRGEPAIINLNDIVPDDAQRILDFMSGAIYALNGNIHRVVANIFLLSPDGVEITVPVSY
jgi:cell division inhibitor SepF